MTKKILHLSHTDIRSDSRILKEMEAIKGIDGVQLSGLGVLLNESEAPPTAVRDMNIVAIPLYTRVFQWLPRPLRYALNFAELTIKILLRGWKIRPYIIHCHDTLVLPAGVLLKLISNSLLVYDAHELESNKNGQSRFLSMSTFAVERFAWRSVDHLVTVSDKIIEWYHESFGAKPATLILNSPQIKREEFAGKNLSRIDSLYLRRKFEIPDRCKVFLYLGIIGKGRGIEIALDAFSCCHSDAHFVMVGYGSLVPLAKEAASRLNNIHYHEAVPHDEVVTIASSADVGLCLIENVSLSDYYCLPNKLFEYAFAGLYVLSCNFPEIRRVVHRHGLGSTCDLDADSLVAEIERICIHGAHHETRDLDLLSWDTQAVRLRQTYHRLLAQ